jgi:hypothetical protein
MEPRERAGEAVAAIEALGNNKVVLETLASLDSEFDGMVDNLDEKQTVANHIANHNKNLEDYIEGPGNHETTKSTILAIQISINALYDADGKLPTGIEEAIDKAIDKLVAATETKKDKRAFWRDLFGIKKDKKTIKPGGSVNLELVDYSHASEENSYEKKNVSTFFHLYYRDFKDKHISGKIIKEKLDYAIGLGRHNLNAKKNMGTSDTSSKDWTIGKPGSMLDSAETGIDSILSSAGTLTGINSREPIANVLNLSNEELMDPAKVREARNRFLESIKIYLRDSKFRRELGGGIRDFKDLNFEEVEETGSSGEKIKTDKYKITAEYMEKLKKEDPLAATRLGDLVDSIPLGAGDVEGYLKALQKGEMSLAYDEWYENSDPPHEKMEKMIQGLSKMVSGLFAHFGKFFGGMFPSLSEWAVTEKLVTIEKEVVDEVEITDSRRIELEAAISQEKIESKEKFDKMFAGGTMPENATNPETGELNDIYSAMYELFTATEDVETGGIAERISQEKFAEIKSRVLNGNIFMENGELTYKIGGIGNGVKIKNWGKLSKLSLIKLKPGGTKKYKEIESKISDKDLEVLKSLGGNLETRNNELKLKISGNKEEKKLIIDLTNLEPGEISKMNTNLKKLQNTELKLPENLELSRKQLKSEKLGEFLDSIKYVVYDIEEADSITHKLISRAIEKGVVLMKNSIPGGDINWKEDGRTYDFDRFEKLEKDLNTIDIFKNWPNNRGLLVDGIGDFPKRGGIIEMHTISSIYRNIDITKKNELISALKSDNVKNFFIKLKDLKIDKHFNEFNLSNSITFELLKAIERSSADFLSIEENNNANNRKVEDNNKNIDWGSGDLRIKVGSDWHDFDDSSDLLTILNSSTPSAIPNASEASSSSTP